MSHSDITRALDCENQRYLYVLTLAFVQIAHLSSVAAQCTSNDLKMVVRLIKRDLRINAGAKPMLERCS
ncbi:hypothetical protein HAZT_HAZT007532 [Hyalella azteca]|uniref:DNA ligase ATP-dependent N-terminal domain-containing protein n=1 Tax=Hyalella azteca TaxID=294128 RepID=A0A6A0H653_HYAAZ|nr:hypothetical protein HAZT_HAZT007532 [Hyalella azteca]